MKIWGLEIGAAETVAPSASMTPSSNPRSAREVGALSWAARSWASGPLARLGALSHADRCDPRG